jgi:hypothetical protein
MYVTVGSISSTMTDYLDITDHSPIKIKLSPDFRRRYGTFPPGITVIRSPISASAGPKQR